MTYTCMHLLVVAIHIC